MKINFGAVVNDARGKIRGNVFSKNKSGAYVRGKVTPANPNTPAQSSVRTSFGTLAQAWSGTLSAADRATWLTYAATYPRIDIFGASIQISGLNMFMSLNRVLNQIGNATVLTAPASNVVTPISLDPASLIATAAGNVLTVSQLAAFPGNSNAYVFGTRLLPPGRTPQKNDFRYLELSAGVAGPYPAPLTVSAAWVARFGNLIAGQRVALLIASVDITNGLTTVGTIFDTIVA